MIAMKYLEEWFFKNVYTDTLIQMLRCMGGLLRWRIVYTILI